MPVYVIKFEKILLVFLSAILLTAIISAYKNESRMSMAMPTAKKTIIIDAGHGGWDPGKPGSQGADEDEINLEIAAYLQSYLEQTGAIVIVTRLEDEALGDTKKIDMKERANIANGSKGDILISIHQNSYPEESVQGPQVFYYGDSTSGKALAEHVYQALQDQLGSDKPRPIKESTDYYILKETAIPAIIVECGFLTNQEEEALLNDEDYQKKIAWAIYKGIVDYYAQTEQI